ncbi:MAG: hypothetical protein AAFS03_10110 [Pseudomonadota bacterium]
MWSTRYGVMQRVHSKTSTLALRRFFEAREVSAPADFDWRSEGRGTALVRSIDGMLEHTHDKRLDAVKAELDHLASLPDGNGMLSAEQVCAGQGIDIEGGEGVQDVLLMLAIDHPTAFDRVSAQASLLRRTGGRNWSAFQFGDDCKPWSLNDDEVRDAFLNEAIEILDLPAHRRREAD